MNTTTKIDFKRFGQLSQNGEITHIKYGGRLESCGRFVRDFGQENDLEEIEAIITRIEKNPDNYLMRLLLHASGQKSLDQLKTRRDKIAQMDPLQYLWNKVSNKPETPPTRFIVSGGMRLYPYETKPAQGYGLPKSELSG